MEDFFLTLARAAAAGSWPAAACIIAAMVAIVGCVYLWYKAVWVTHESVET